MPINHWPAWLLIVSGMAGSVLLKKLTVTGAVVGGMLGLMVYAGAGYTGLAQMTLFFVLGTAATAWHKSEKIKNGLAETGETQRTAAQVVANAGVAAGLALTAWLHSEQAPLYRIMAAAAFASATADTLSSELGNVYGRRFYNILTFKKDHKGQNGVVSFEGTAAGLAGTTLIALVHVLGWGWQPAPFIIIIFCGTIGNFADSLLGATLEQKGILKNNSVNFLNTSIAAVSAFFLCLLFSV